MNIFKTLLLIAGIANSAIYAIPPSLVDKMDDAIRAIRALRLNQTPEAQEQIEQYQREIVDLQNQMDQQKELVRLENEMRAKRAARYPAWRALEDEKERLEREAFIAIRKKANPIALEKAIARKEAAIAESQKSLAAWKSLDISKRSKKYMTSRHEQEIKNRSIELQRLYNELAPIRAYISDTESEIGAIQAQQRLL